MALSLTLSRAMLPCWSIMHNPFVRSPSPRSRHITRQASSKLSRGLRGWSLLASP